MASTQQEFISARRRTVKLSQSNDSCSRTFPYHIKTKPPCRSNSSQYSVQWIPLHTRAGTPLSSRGYPWPWSPADKACPAMCCKFLLVNLLDSHGIPKKKKIGGVHNSFQLSALSQKIRTLMFIVQVAVLSVPVTRVPVRLGYSLPS